MNLGQGMVKKYFFGRLSGASEFIPARREDAKKLILAGWFLPPENVAFPWPDIFPEGKFLPSVPFKKEGKTAHFAHLVLSFSCEIH